MKWTPHASTSLDDALADPDLALAAFAQGRAI